MKKFVPLLIALSLSLSCSTMPDLLPLAGNGSAGVLGNCMSAFSGKARRYIHSIEATFPGGSTGNFIGVTAVNPVKKKIHCVLMSLEGLVLFEAVRDGGLRVDRAVTPLDNPEFAKGLMDDIALVYFAPADTAPQAGTAGDTAICRYKTGTFFTDVMIKKGGWEIVKYDGSKNIVRTVTAAETGAGGIPGKITLKAPGLIGYSLTLSLIESEEMH